MMDYIMNLNPSHLGPARANSLKKNSNISKQDLIMMIANAPWFVRNQNIHKDFKVSYLEDHIKNLADSFFKSVQKPAGSIYYQLDIGLPILCRHNNFVMYIPLS